MSSAVTSGLNSLNSLSTSLNQYVVTPLQAFGLGGFVFDIEGEARVELTNEITDHYVENNSVVQDHIAVKPKKITLRNYVGELVYPTPASSITGIVNTVVQKLTTLTAALPALSAGAAQANSIFGQSQAGTLSGGALVTAGAGTAANLYGLVKNLISAQSNKQQAAYQYFKALRDQKTLFAIQTPFEFMTNMAIETIVAIQPEDSIYISTFSITLKEIRTASTTTANVGAGASSPTPSTTSPGGLTGSVGGGLVAGSSNPSDLQGRLAQQAATITQQGSMPGQDPASILNTPISATDPVQAEFLLSRGVNKPIGP